MLLASLDLGDIPNSAEKLFWTAFDRWLKLPFHLDPTQRLIGQMNHALEVEWLAFCEGGCDRLLKGSPKIGMKKFAQKAAPLTGPSSRFRPKISYMEIVFPVEMIFGGMPCEDSQFGDVVANFSLARFREDAEPPSRFPWCCGMHRKRRRFCHRRRPG